MVITSLISQRKTDILHVYQGALAADHTRLITARTENARFCYELHSQVSGVCCYSLSGIMCVDCATDIVLFFFTLFSLRCATSLVHIWSFNPLMICCGLLLLLLPSQNVTFDPENVGVTERQASNYDYAATILTSFQACFVVEMTD